MRIIVDCNNDKVVVNDYKYIPCKHPEQVVEILKQIFDMLDDSTVFNIELEKIDEDTRTSIGEW